MDKNQPIQLPITTFSEQELRLIFEVFSNPSIVFPAAKGVASNGVLTKAAKAIGEKIGQDPPAAA